ncbi:MAG: hypothetical protein IKB73_01410 [Ruminococcus sp.]|nr:hypothetical protein [Ruminococcus sp.]
MDLNVKAVCYDIENVEVDPSLALRFLRVRSEVDDSFKDIFKECLSEFYAAVSYKVCYRVFDISIDGKNINFSDEMVLSSEKLSANLRNCKKAVVFVATTSLSVDRLISKHIDLRVSKALLIDAIGSAAVEALCDKFSHDLSKELKVDFRPRFSPGYGDLSIVCQKDVMKVLDTARKIGVTLNDNHMMIPRKSVSAIMGIE